jgi:hypothetical protein
VRSECGQASIEWTALVLSVSLVLGALLLVGPRVDGRPLGAYLAHAIVCAVRGGCDDGNDALAREYGRDSAELVRRYAPNIVYEPGTYSLPVDWRACRKQRCSDAPDHPDLDVHRAKRTGTPATVFTRLLRDQGRTFIQYWFYYPVSNTACCGAERAWGMADTLSFGALPEWPGRHLDDWEGFQLRISRSGDVSARATSHGGYQTCKESRCRNQWTPSTGWTRVSKGSHAGHIPLEPVAGLFDPPPDPHIESFGDHRFHPLYPGVDTHERTTTAPGLRLVPLEGIDTRGYRPLDRGVKPPWRKRVYWDPWAHSS